MAACWRFSPADRPDWQRLVDWTHTLYAGMQHATCISNPFIYTRHITAQVCIKSRFCENIPAKFRESPSKSSVTHLRNVHHGATFQPRNRETWL